MRPVKALHARVRHLLRLPPVVTLIVDPGNELSRFAAAAQRREAERMGWRVRERRP